MPAPAGNSGSEPAVPVGPVPVCHAGGRGFESRRSRKKSCKSACCVVDLDVGSRPTTQTLQRGDPKRRKPVRNRSGGSPFQANQAELRPVHEKGVRLHETTGGHGRATRRLRPMHDRARDQSLRARALAPRRAGSPRGRRGRACHLAESCIGLAIRRRSGRRGRPQSDPRAPSRTARPGRGGGGDSG